MGDQEGGWGSRRLGRVGMGDLEAGDGGDAGTKRLGMGYQEGGDGRAGGWGWGTKRGDGGPGGWGLGTRRVGMEEQEGGRAVL